MTTKQTLIQTFSSQQMNQKTTNTVIITAVNFKEKTAKNIEKII